jgi:N-acetylmuramoyl-L-alanine amidase
MNLSKKKRRFSRFKSLGMFYFLFCLCVTIIPSKTFAESSTNVVNAPETTWNISFFNNLNFEGKPLSTTTSVLPLTPIIYTYPIVDETQLKTIKSIRSTASMKILKGKYDLNIEYIGKINIYLDNKLITQEESVLSSKLLKKSVTINDLLTQSTSRDTHTIRIEQSNFGTVQPKLNFTLNPIQQTVDLTQKDIAYNWGYSSPLGYPNDQFSLSFNNTSMYTKGDYFASIFSEDDVNILFDDQKILESNSLTDNKFNNAVIENVTDGVHTVKTNFIDSNGGEASLYSGVTPFSNWVAYYYNNTAFTGQPVARQVLANPNPNVLLRATNESQSPIPTIVASNYYGVRYITYKRLPAGTYNLEYKSGEGVGVYLDGKPIAYEWKDGKKPLKKIPIKISNTTLNASSKDIHQIMVRTYNRKSPQNLMVSITPATSSSNSIKTIVIDPGHGGTDTGAIGIGGLKEKDVVLDVSKRVEALFNELTPYKVYLTRTKDIFIPLPQRPAFAIKKKAHAFVSIHANAASPSASGLETYYYGLKSSSSTIKQNAVQNGPLTNSFFLKESSTSSVLKPNSSKTNPYITDSRALAIFIQKRMVKAYQLADRGAKHGNFQVIRANKLPAVLTELGFITNKNDAGKLGSPYWRQVAAEAIYMGILDYFESKGSKVNSYRLN